MGTEYQVKKKSRKGMIAGIIILVLVLGAGVYGYIWYNGIFAMPDELNNDIIPTAEMISFYDNNILQKSPSNLELDTTLSKYVYSRLNKETNFFNLPGSSPVIETFRMYPDGNNMHLAMKISVNDGKTSLLPSPEDLFFGSQKVYAADTFAFLNNKEYGITATLSLKTLPDGSIGMKPTSVSVGNSPMPVGVAMNLAKQYAPSMEVTSDGYIVMKPTQIKDKAGKIMGMFSGLEVKDGKSYLTIK